MRSQVFQDFDAFAESVQGVESKMLLRNPKHRLWSVTGVDLNGIDIQVGRLGSGNIAQGELRPDGFMVYLPLSAGVEYTVNGNVMEESSFAVLEPSCDFCISTNVEHDWCVAFVPTRLLSHDNGIVTPTHTCRVTRPMDHAAEEFQSTILETMQASSLSNSFETTQAAENAAAEVLKLAEIAIGRKQKTISSQEGRPKVPRQLVIRRCLEHLDRRTGEPANVSGLAKASGVSERTLRSIFKEYFGVSPNQYLQLRLLNQVNRMLKTADKEETTVSNVLVEHGEWAFGRFASRYRQLFGELPSETLQAKKS